MTSWKEITYCCFVRKLIKREVGLKWDTFIILNIYTQDHFIRMVYIRQDGAMLSSCLHQILTLLSEHHSRKTETH